MKIARATALRGSLRLRLLAGTLLWVAASLVVAGLALDKLFRDHVAEQFHAALQTHLDQLTAGFVVDEQGRPALATPLSDPRLSRPYGGLYWQIDRLAGDGSAAATGVLRSRSLWDSVLAVPSDSLADGEMHRHRVAGPEGSTLGLSERSVRFDGAAAASATRWRLIVAADERLIAEPVARFSGALWRALALLGVGLALAVLVQVVVGLAPLRRLRVALGRVRDGRSERLQGNFPVELMPLVEDFNGVLAHNGEVLRRARTQAGNLAHALKTPLSVLANAAHGRQDEESRMITEQVEVARRQVDYHLARAQAAAVTHGAGARTLLAPVIAGLLRTMRRIHAERPLELQVGVMPEALAFRGEVQDLQEMLGNLLDNACKWATQRVELAAQRDGEMLRITIDDDGSGVAAAQRDAVLGRGVRADEQTPGSGLGLAIVDELARLYGGHVDLAASPLHGLRVTLSLPAAV
ncbi:MAG TPA: sensor histidine kinase [Candidatus Accumulibacter phosphatis]|nr:MAG: Virulence sensor histidine kinase PhoQ [Candidatus Accumulibacter sp. SK-11]HRL77678.1 sensor histidine kinase [Candidatus Accumulibacter phosphatis]HRQ95999.1 sensor histidine kinase [Candidatus Accumulibacter phosphatis]